MDVDDVNMRSHKRTRWGAAYNHDERREISILVESVRRGKFDNHAVIAWQKLQQTDAVLQKQQIIETSYGTASIICLPIMLRDKDAEENASYMRCLAMTKKMVTCGISTEHPVFEKDGGSTSLVQLLDDAPRFFIEFLLQTVTFPQEALVYLVRFIILSPESFGKYFRLWKYFIDGKVQNEFIQGVLILRVWARKDNIPLSNVEKEGYLLRLNDLDSCIKRKTGFSIDQLAAKLGFVDFAAEKEIPEDIVDLLIIYVE